jgi:hypothetical protein
MVAPLDFIAQMIQDNHWGYLYSCECSVYPRLVRIILQTRVREHTIQIDPQLISSIIDVPVLDISASPFLEILEPPSLEHIMDFFDAHPEDEERAHSHIKIGAFSPPHRLVAKIVLHNLSPIARRSELVLKRVRFLYTLVTKLPFCLYKHILQIMLEMRDEHVTGLPFACLLTEICLRFVTDNAETEPKVRIQDDIGNQTLDLRVKAKHHSLLQYRVICMQLPPPLRLLHLLHPLMLALLR